MRLNYRNWSRALVMAAMIFAAGCRETALDIQESGVNEFRFYPALDGSIASKAIGDAGSIDQLRIGVYTENTQGLSCTDIVTKTWSEVQQDGVNLKLTSGNTYKIIFWAEDKDNTAYNFKEDGSIVADYSGYKTAGFAKMEELDAFFAVSSVVPGQSQTSQRVVLKRPFAQMNFADSIKPETGVHTAKVIFHSLPYSFNPFTGEVKATDHIDDSDEITFTFTDFQSESLTSDGREYFYVSTNYLFAPSDGFTDVACTVELQENGTVVTRHEFKGKKSIVIEQRKKVNMIGYMMPEPEVWSEWNGKYPSVCTLTADPSDQNCYIIDDAEDLAWLSNALNAASLGEGKTFRLQTNIDMRCKPSQSSLKLPANSTFDGNGFTIRGIRMMVGFFGDIAADLNVRNLAIDDAVITSTTNSHKGILANTLCGNCTISNVTVSNSSVKTMNGVAGGFVGYVRRTSADDRSEKMQVVFDDCHLVNTTVEANGREGYFVGMFRGYDYGEMLKFNDNCTFEQAPGASAVNSSGLEGNEAVWIASNDYSKYNGWLGKEECYRGMLYFGDKRFVAKWDGKTSVTPLLADPVYDDSAEYKVSAGTNRYVIYSAFDLAGARTKTSSPKALYFKTSVDMNGQGKDGKYHVPNEFTNRKCASSDDNWFKRFSYIKHLDGQNNTIYNLSLNSKAINDSSYISAFINSVQKDTVTVHKNLVFRNCCSVAPVVQREGQAAGQDLSGGAIFIYNTGPDKTGSPTYTMDNVHIYDSQVFAIQHSGVLAGIVSRGNLNNCSVNNCYIENYKCQQTWESFVKKVTIAGSDITISANFYSYGEVGALVGMVRRESNITNCHVRNSIVHAYGEPDKEADMSSDGILGKLAISTAKSMGYYLVPGRHVSTMIGDIRTMSGETIRISNCSVDASTKCTAEQYKHNSSFPYIGQAYYIQFSDTKGQVIVEGKTLTLADGNKKTSR